MALLLSDDEYLSWWEARGNACKSPCGLCLTFATTTPLLGCHKHAACSDCTFHASTCNVTSCPLCPPPVARLDTLCCNVQGTGTCQVCQTPPVLLRHFLRRGAYTNFLTRAEYEERAALLARVQWALICPCGEAFDLHSACNEVVHCRTAVCAECGAVALPGEVGLRVHRQDGCSEWPQHAQTRQTRQEAFETLHSAIR